MNDDEFTKSMAVLIAAYPGVDIRKPTIELYFKMLGDLDYATMEKAVLKVISDFKADYGNKFPTISHIRDAATAITQGQYPNGEQAWGVVMDEVRRGVGYPYAGGPSSFQVETTITDPAILESVRAIGGWRLLQESTLDQDVSHRSRFVKCYEQMTARRSELARQLPNVREAMTAPRLNGPSTVADILKQLEKPQ